MIFMGVQGLRKVSVWYERAAIAWMQTGFLCLCEFKANVNGLGCTTAQRVGWKCGSIELAKATISKLLLGYPALLFEVRLCCISG